MLLLLVCGCCRRERAPTLSSPAPSLRPDPTRAPQESSRDALDWLQQQGVELSSTVQLGGHSRKRTHANPSGPNVGYAIMKALLERLDKAPNVEVVSGAKVCGWFSHANWTVEC